EKYVSVGRQVRAMMQALTPLVEPISIDEAFLDLAGTERLHGLPPALVLARFVLAVERKSASPSRPACLTASSWPRSRRISASRAASRSSGRPKPLAFWRNSPSR